jgi:peroxiredoxin
MHRIVFAAIAAACVACVSTAGKEHADDKKADKSGDKKKVLTRRERLIQIVKDQNKDWHDRSDALNAMKPGAERDRATEALQVAGLSFAQKALDLAREDEKDEIAFSAAFFAFTGGGGTKTTTDAADFIARRLANDMKIVPTMRQMAHTRGGLDLLARLAENTRTKEIRGAARFTILDAEVDGIDRPPSGMPLSAGEAAARFAAATDKLKKLSTEFTGVKVSTHLGDSISEAAQKKIFFIDNLTAGKRAPDFECELLDGKKARLSDFLGNVVVLDVWATWCAPCRAMIPHQRKLVEKLKGKPFKLISVSADDEKATLTRFLEKEKMPWTHMWSGATGGFIDQYQVWSFPTVYILDAKGTIRFKHIRNERMDRAVEALLEEMGRMK